MAVHAGPKTETDGLLLNLDTGNFKSTDGSTWRDSTNQQAGFTLYNNPSTSRWPPSYLFNGSNQYASGGNNNNLNPPTITVETFTKATSEGSLGHVMNIVGKGNWNFATGRLILGYKSDSGIKLTFVYRCQGWYEGPSLSINDFDATQWHHIVGTSDGTADRLYMDGVLIASSTSNYGTYVQNSEDLYVATSYASAFYPGNISNVRIYNRALSLSDIEQNYKVLKSRYGL